MSFPRKRESRHLDSCFRRSGTKQVDGECRRAKQPELNPKFKTTNFKIHMFEPFEFGEFDIV
jgi:hypothetical protein